MKKVAAISLLGLLLCNMFGLSFAILYFENQYASVPVSYSAGDDQTLKIFLPSIPYTENWENQDGIDGLLRHDGNFYNATNIAHKNDTLYIALTDNQMARDHFFELSNMMETATNPDCELPQNATGKAFHLLTDLSKIYLQNKFSFTASGHVIDECLLQKHMTKNLPVYLPCQIQLSTPPPELS